MSIKLEGQEKIIAMLPCVYQDDPKSFFHAGVLALTDEAVVLFNDTTPDSSIDGVYSYNIKRKVVFDDLYTVINEYVEELNGNAYERRINLLSKNESDCVYFYYMKEDMKYVRDFLKECQNHNIKVENKKVKPKEA